VDEHSDAGSSPVSSRRDVLKKAAVGGAIVWVAPTILASRAGAQGTCLSFLADWDLVQVPGSGVLTVNGGNPIGSTGFNGTNIDVVSPAFGGDHPVWATGSTWLDLVGSGTAGSITGDFEIPCNGTFELEFTYSRYTNDLNQTLTVDVDGVTTGPIVVPSDFNPAVFNQSYGPFSIGDIVTVTLSGVGVASAGPAIGDIVFTRA